MYVVEWCHTGSEEQFETQHDTARDYDTLPDLPKLVVLLIHKLSNVVLQSLHGK
jgi:hypothetical protein